MRRRDVDSPTSSAIMAGLRGRPRPRRARSADEVGADVGGLGEDAAAERGQRRSASWPEPRPMSVSIALVFIGVGKDQHAVVAGDAEQRKPRDQHAGDGIYLEVILSALDTPQPAPVWPPGRSGAHRDVHLMKPAAPEKVLLIRKPIATRMPLASAASSPIASTIASNPPPRRTRSCTGDGGTPLGGPALPWRCPASPGYRARRAASAR